MVEWTTTSKWTTITASERRILYFSDPRKRPTGIPKRSSQKSFLGHYKNVKENVVGSYYKMKKWFVEPFGKREAKGAKKTVKHVYYIS